ncbi:MAG: hypothetical protein EOO61_17055 [Hymenobacter sp.]|nr:MAG: hypothetical protein EOO61_17055 [Hymenobacter sp.]
MEVNTETAKYVIAYLAYGLESTKYQAILSIYTLYHHVGEVSKDFLFVIYTDSDRRLLDKYLGELPVRLEILTKEQVKSFKGPDNYVFRLKPSIIKDYFSKYKQNLLYMDTDTFFLRDPTELLASITPGHSVMNVEEYNFVDAGAVEPLHWFTMRQGLKQSTYTVNGEQVAVPLATMMWNAGIIGLAQADSKLLDLYISLTDEMFSRCKSFIVEQFVASYVLQLTTQVRSTGDYIDHYWPKAIKHTFNLRIPFFLKDNAAKTGKELYASAFAFAKECRTISTPYQEPLATRINTRLKLIMKVARKGYI